MRSSWEGVVWARRSPVAEGVYIPVYCATKRRLSRRQTRQLHMCCRSVNCSARHVFCAYGQDHAPIHTRSCVFVAIPPPGTGLCGALAGIGCDLSCENLAWPSISSARAGDMMEDDVDRMPLYTYAGGAEIIDGRERGLRTGRASACCCLGTGPHQRRS